MDPTVKKLIAKTVTSAVTAAVDVIQAKPKEEMLVLQEMIKKFLLLRKSPSTIPPLDPNITFKAHLDANSLSMITTKR